MGCMLHQKNSTKAYKKASLSPRPKPHHLMKCERAVRHRRMALSHFGGRGGTSSPHTQKKDLFKQKRAEFGATGTGVLGEFLG